MDVSPLIWCVSIGVALAILFVDVAVVGRRPHVPSAAECLRYLGVYIGLALVFAGVVALVWGTAPAGVLRRGRGRDPRGCDAQALTPSCAGRRCSARSVATCACSARTR